MQFLHLNQTLQIFLFILVSIQSLIAVIRDSGAGLNAYFEKLHSSICAQARLKFVKCCTALENIVNIFRGSIDEITVTIDGSTCDVTSATPTEITCSTNSHQGSIRTKVQ